MELSKDEFLKKYDLVDKFPQAQIDWQILADIANNYESKKSSFQNVALRLVEQIQSFDNVHSVRFRLKDTEHLLEKIIRKAIENVESDSTEYSVDTYLTEITDIVGIRALYVFKSDVVDLHHRIVKEYKSMFAEKPQIKLRTGDSRDIYEKLHNIEIQENAIYRSNHYTLRYLLQDNQFVHVEIQTRSIFEEGWSEINHRMLYKQPENKYTVLLQQASSILSSLAGDCDVFAQLMKNIQDFNFNQPLTKEKNQDLFSSNAQFIQMLEQSLKK